MKSLSLRKDVLAELSTDQLRAVAAGSTLLCVSNYGCTLDCVDISNSCDCTW